MHTARINGGIMEVEFLYQLSMVFYVITAVLIIISIILFFLLDIRGAYGRISGKAQKREISRMRNGDKAITSDEKVKIQESYNTSGETEVLSTVIEDCTEVLSHNEATEILNQASEQENYGETEVLNVNSHTFEIEIEMGYCSSEEIIQ